MLRSRYLPYMHSMCCDTLTNQQLLWNPYKCDVLSDMASIDSSFSSQLTKCYNYSAGTVVDPALMVAE